MKCESRARGSNDGGSPWLRRMPGAALIALILAFCPAFAAGADHDAERLIERLGDRDPIVREEAFERLWQLGEAAEPALRRHAEAGIADPQAAARVGLLLEQIRLGIRPHSPEAVVRHAVMARQPGPQGISARRNLAANGSAAASVISRLLRDLHAQATAGEEVPEARELLPPPQTQANHLPPVLLDLLEHDAGDVARWWLELGWRGDERGAHAQVLEAWCGLLDEAQAGEALERLGAGAPQRVRARLLQVAGRDAEAAQLLATSPRVGDRLLPIAWALLGDPGENPLARMRGPELPPKLAAAAGSLLGLVEDDPPLLWVEGEVGGATDAAMTSPAHTAALPTRWEVLGKLYAGEPAAALDALEVETEPETVIFYLFRRMEIQSAEEAIVRLRAGDHPRAPHAHSLLRQLSARDLMPKPRQQPPQMSTWIRRSIEAGAAWRAGEHERAAAIWQIQADADPGEIALQWLASYAAGDDARRARIEEAASSRGARSRLAEAAWGHGMDEQALALLETVAGRAILDTGEGIEWLLDYAMRLEESGQPVRARRALGAAGILLLAMEPDELEFGWIIRGAIVSAELRRLRMKEMMEAGDWEAAEGELAKIRELSPGAPQGTIDFVRGADAAGRRDLGNRAFIRHFEMYEALLEQHARSPRYLNLAAWLAIECRRRPESARQLAHRAAEADSSLPANLDTLAEYRLQSGDHAGALELMERVLAEAERQERLAVYLRRYASFVERGRIEE